MPIIIHCKRCGEVKDKIEKNGTRRCSKCRRDQVKERLDRKRAEKGLKPIWRGGGRNPHCYSCGKLKENPKIGYCHTCKNEKERARTLRTGKVKKHRTGKCKCGKDFASYSGYQCVDCYRETRQAKRKNPKNKDFLLKDEVRMFTRKCIKIGILIKENCKVCGTNENIEAHHEDYTKPLDVIWLCRNHHREHHRSFKFKCED